MRLRDIYQRFAERVHFVPIYIREAHPTDGWWLGGGVVGFAMRLGGLRAATDVADPVTLEQRQAVAARCENALQYGARTYVDDLNDTVNRAYAAWPTRLYLVGTDQMIIYAGGPGPFGFKPKGLAVAIDRCLAATL